ncbi:HEAT repeat domain-containing protein [Inmirania thermothiophila]|uniref:Thioredoxin-like protein n=1 Tax=Inmirania thermothiophila TaxID=1750597 RepID=A0A3N1Y3P5_9GAMM|nr:HEAT repeat domain-containing protein [Inmirania thermothiophila]ROR32202.1 hypothetical protein EDC57_1399 [Inmirania thermothiophila]
MHASSRHPTPPPTAELLVAPGCPHCAHMERLLTALQREGLIARLEVVDLARHPERAEALGLRGVPWLRLGPFELEGLHGPDALRRWIERTGTVEGHAEYVRSELAGGRLSLMERRVLQAPGRWTPALLHLLAREDLDLKVRLGLDALLEMLAREGLLEGWIEALAELARGEGPARRADAAHYLGLTGSPAAVGPVEALLEDPDPQVRDIAREARANLPTAH